MTTPSLSRFLGAILLTAGLPLMAHAQVSIFGSVDLAYVSSSASGMKRSAIDSGSKEASTIGFRGKENLGNGLNAEFYLDYGIAPDNNGGIGAAQFGSRSLARTQYVGLSGDFGQLVAGRVGSPINYLQDHDAMSGSSASPLVALLPATVNGRTDITRLSNAVRFTSTPMHGWKVIVAYGFAPYSAAGDTAAYSDHQERVVVGGVVYRDGNFSATLAHQRTSDRAVTPRADLRDSGLGASYDFGPIKLMAEVVIARRGDEAGPNSMNLYLLGATAPIGEHSLVRLQGGRLRNLTLPDADARSWALGYDYTLSKRTTLYAQYNRADNDATVSYAADIFNRPQIGDSARLLTTGIRHTF